MIEILGSLAYSIIENSWQFSTVFVKYLLVIGLFYSFNREKRIEAYRNFLLDYSREAVGMIVLIGTVSMIVGYSFTPMFAGFSSLIAVAYFGYLFWKF